MDSKENSRWFRPENSDPKRGRIRGENWTQEEKDLFVQLMRQSAAIMENKLNDTNSIQRKNLEWANIQNKLMKLTGKRREIRQLKGFWNRGKIAAKKARSEHRSAFKADIDGEQPLSPPPDEIKVMELSPFDFVESSYDSDANLTGQDSPDGLDTTMDELVDEHKLKVEYQKRELAHQKIRHQLEIEIFMLEKEKKILELELLKKKL